MATTESEHGPAGVITTVAGTGRQGFSGDGGPALQAQLDFPSGMAVSPQGDLYIADDNNNRVRKVSASDQTITTVAGSDEQGSGGDGGPATQAELRVPDGVALDALGNLYITESTNLAVRKVSASDQTITTVSRGLRDYSSSIEPHAVTVGPQGDIYFADSKTHQVGKLSAADRTVTTIAGTGEYGYSGDGGPAAAARLCSPHGVALDAQGNLYIADTGNQRVRRVSASDGTITTVVGTGEYGFSGDDGPATQTHISAPDGLALDGQGNLYIADGYRVRRVSAGDQTITTVAGTGKRGHSGDGGPATQAELDVYGVALDAQGNLYISGGHVVRKVTFTASKPKPPAPAPVVKVRANLSGVGACNGQKAAAGSAFANRLTVSARDADNGSPLAGLHVVFTVSGDTGSHFPNNAVSVEVVADAQGTVTAPELTAGPTPGPVTISMEARYNPGSNPAHYQAEVTPA
ncbi:hypothetical protein ACF08M_38435 [Streptomyces sp. NPDC015032]|uniref:NHL domain-containing protein n=1 Tax=Streptomyces sp. NPDC015032 TaxID=3364937 RepID=UPI0037008529